MIRVIAHEMFEHGIAPSFNLRRPADPEDPGDGSSGRSDPWPEKTDRSRYRLEVGVDDWARDGIRTSVLRDVDNPTVRVGLDDEAAPPLDILLLAELLGNTQDQ